VVEPTCHELGVENLEAGRLGFAREHRHGCFDDDGVAFV
jgi:hypothetical protein